MVIVEYLKLKTNLYYILFKKGEPMTNLATKAVRRIKGSNNSTIVLIGGAIVIVIVIIALLAFLLLKGGSSGGEAGQLAKFFPEKTVIYAELQVTPEKFEDIQALSGDSFSMEKIAEGIKEASKSPKDTFDAMQFLTEFNKTLEPAFAMGVWAKDEEDATLTKVLIATIVKDKNNVPALFEKMSQGDATFKPETIDGVEYQVSTQKDSGGYVVIGNVLLISDKIETLQEAVAFQKHGETNVLANADAKQVLSNLQPERIFTMLINAKEISKLPQMKQKAENQALDKLFKSMSYMGAGVDIHGQVMEGKFYAPYSLAGIEDPQIKTTFEKLFSVSSKLDAPKVLPADTFAFFSISGMSYMVETSVQFMDPKGQQDYNQQKQMVSMFTGLDLETDILPLFSEELTVSGQIAGNQVEPVVVLTKRPESLNVLNKLVKSIAGMDPATSVSEQEMNGSTFSIVSTSAAPFKMGFGQIAEVITLAKADTLESLAVASSDSSKSLAGSPLYKEISKYAPSKVAMAMYINFDKFVEAAKLMKQSEKQITELEEVSKNLSAMFISAGDKDNKAIEGSLLLQFKKK